MQKNVGRVAAPSDEQLMRLTQSGDSEAFGALFDRYQKAIFNFCYRMVGDRGHAESLAQEGFLRVLKRAGSYRYPETFSTWLYTVARNACIDFERKKGSRFQGIPDAVTAGLETDRSERPSSQIASDEEILGLRQAISELPDLYREVVILRVFQRMPFRNIARVVGCPESTARSRMGYALDILRKTLLDRKT